MDCDSPPPPENPHLRHAPEEVKRMSCPTDHNRWLRWGPYLSDRQWGTVREQLDESVSPWDSFTHDMARSHAYQWGEDGLAGFSDCKQYICMGLALWNGKDPILKERLFGLTNSEGNHGEDVKEVYFHEDALPSHAYLRMTYRYPQNAFPYDDLVATNHKRTRKDPEYELWDTGCFAENRFFDVTVEYAKGDPEDILMRVTVLNQGPETATIHVLPQLWLRNVWSHPDHFPKPLESQPILKRHSPGDRCEGGLHASVQVQHPWMNDEYLWACEDDPRILFCDNETNPVRFPDAPPPCWPSGYYKDGFNEHIVGGNSSATNTSSGTRVTGWHILTLAPGASATVRSRLTRIPKSRGSEALRFSAEHVWGCLPFSDGFSQIFSSRISEADKFYDYVAGAENPLAETTETLGINSQHKLVLRQALAGLIWSKQYYWYDLGRWLKDRGVGIFQVNARRKIRNGEWFHMINDFVVSMPDKWEYPWYAAWDLAFQAVAFGPIDIEFGKNQARTLLQERYQHPNGQIPAYEWCFSDVNPPVTAWAVLNLYHYEHELRGTRDYEFLEFCFNKLLANFTWWLNRKDRAGNNLFEGGFLGLDNIGLFDRNMEIPGGGYIEQADSTAWMTLFTQNMLEIALELADYKPSYEDFALKFLEQFLWIHASILPAEDNDTGMWDEETGFFYDLLKYPDGTTEPLLVRSMVGLLPLCAATSIRHQHFYGKPELVKAIKARLAQFPELTDMISFYEHEKTSDRSLLSLLDENRLRKVLAKLFDPEEFLSPYGLRSLSKYHEKNPSIYTFHNMTFEVRYEPGESHSDMFGGNSNWRGPVWLPMNTLILRALMMYYQYLGPDFLIEYPTGSGIRKNLFAIALDITQRLISIFVPDAHGVRPCLKPLGDLAKDPLWNSRPLFFEYFHADTGAGLGASHQTGWTGIIARMIQIFYHVDPKDVTRCGWNAAMSARSCANYSPNSP